MSDHATGGIIRHVDDPDDDRIPAFISLGYFIPERLAEYYGVEFMEALRASED